MKRVVLVRHAECFMNLEIAAKVGGRSNESPLTPLGIKQAQALGRQLAMCVARHPRLGPCFTSTAVRTRDTMRLALEAAREAGHPWLCSPQGLELTVEADEQLLEISQGEFEGQLRSVVYTAEVMAAIAADPWRYAAPGGECQQQVEQRMTAFITDRVLPLVQCGGPPAVVVTHGLAIKCFLRGVLGSQPAFSRKIQTDNTSVTEVAWVDQPGGSGSWELLRVNDCTHLYMEGMQRLMPE